MGESHALCGHAIEIGRLNCLAAIAAEIMVAHIVYDDEDDIGRCVSSICASESAEQKREYESNWPDHELIDVEHKNNNARVASRKLMNL